MNRRGRTSDRDRSATVLTSRAGLAGAPFEGMGGNRVMYVFSRRPISPPPSQLRARFQHTVFYDPAGIPCGVGRHYIGTSTSLRGDLAYTAVLAAVACSSSRGWRRATNQRVCLLACVRRRAGTRESTRNITLPSCFLLPGQQGVQGRKGHMWDVCAYRHDDGFCSSGHGTQRRAGEEDEPASSGRQDC